MNFFITGNSAVEAGLDLDYISPVNAGAGNFAGKGQTLRQSYSIAQNAFRLAGKNKIDFVLIGLTADSLFRDDNENLTEEVFEDNFQALNDYIKLCNDNGAKAFGVILPFAPSVHDHYKKNFQKPLLDILAEFKQLYNFEVLNFFDMNIVQECFSDDCHLVKEGAYKVSILLTLFLHEQKIFSDEDFGQMSYFYFYYLSYMLDKKNFHAILAKVFARSVDKIRRKEKIKVAFITDHAATWCGDRLYNLFAQNPRFKTTVFIFNGNESTREDTLHDYNQFKAAGINVVGIFDLQEETEPQDIIFFLRPYQVCFSKSFQFDVLTPQTLLIYIPYGFKLTNWIYHYNAVIIHLAWKHFFETKYSWKLFDENCTIGIPQCLVSGLPRLDSIYEPPKTSSFKWKMVRPDAKKIIWAPHWSFENSDKDIRSGTFSYNHKFMYEFAKAHPETSWVVKPHPRLLLAAVQSELFSSIEAYEKYLQAWNDLPNAQVFTGAYYQEIFNTSDGMIHDSISFIAEYQYTNKPMIFLLNEEQAELTALGKKILNVSYVVDGKKLDDIAFAIEKIFIEGNDPLKAERMKVFDAELNYLKFNGMLASDFIYKNVADELGITT